MTYYIGVDTGGTFTDLVLIEHDGKLHFDKAFSTPDDPSRGIMAALEATVQQLNMGVEQVLKSTTRFAHGTTVGTNALIQRKGSRVGLLMTRGFEDTTLITRGPMGKNMGIPISQALDFIHNERPVPLVPKSLIRGIPERISLSGEILSPLDEEAATREIEDLLRSGVASVAVCLLWSFKRPENEQRLRDIIHSIDPKMPVSLSSEVSPIMGEFERAMTTIVNAYIGPTVVRYIETLQGSLQALGLTNPVQVMKCSGGVTMPQDIATRAVSLVNSGPTGGLVAAKHLGAILGHPNVITSDMGGTSFDVGVIHQNEFETEQVPFLDQGIPVQTPAVKLVTIGAGGGSIAWSDGERLYVGPQSAGAVPGPACYGIGDEPTVTDALVVLGILDPARFFGGRKQLDRARAERAIAARVGKPLGLSTLDAAAGIYEIVTAKMSDLIRKVTVESGFDPREFALFAYGGASPAHAVLYAADLGVKEVIIPFTSSVFSALGCALSDITYSYARSEPMVLEDDPGATARFDQVFAELEQTALNDMRASGYQTSEVVLSRRVDLRYEGQMNELTVACALGPLDSTGIQRLRGAFEETYEMRFGRGTSRKESAMEVISFRVDALKTSPKPDLRPEEEGDPDPSSTRSGARTLYLRHTGEIEAAIYNGDLLVPGNHIDGPAIIERRDTTILVPPGHSAHVDGYRNIRLQVTRL